MQSKDLASTLAAIRQFRELGFFQSGPWKTRSVEAIAEEAHRHLGSTAGAPQRWVELMALDATKTFRIWDDFAGTQEEERRLFVAMSRISGHRLETTMEGPYQRVHVNGVLSYASPPSQRTRPLSLEAMARQVGYVNSSLNGQQPSFRMPKAAPRLLVALSEEQQEALEALGTDFDVPSRARVQTWLMGWIAKVRSLGFFTSHSARVKDALGWDHSEPSHGKTAFGTLGDDELAATLVRSFKRAWGRLPNPAEPSDAWMLLLQDASRCWHFDTECAGNGEEAYVDAIHALARISRGLFTVDWAKETWPSDPSEPIWLEATINGGVAWKFGMGKNQDWFDTDLIRLLNQAIAKSGKQFYNWDQDGQDLTLVLLTQEERAALSNAGMNTQAFTKEGEILA